MLKGLKKEFSSKFPKAQEIILENWYKTQESLVSKVHRIKAEAEKEAQVRSTLDILLEIAQRDLLRLTIVVDASEILAAVKFFAEDGKYGLVRIKQTYTGAGARPTVPKV